MVDSKSCIHNLKTNNVPDEVPPLNLWFLGSLLLLNSEAKVCIVFCRIDSVMVSSLRTMGGLSFKMVLFASGFTGVLAK